MKTLLELNQSLENFSQLVLKITNFNNGADEAFAKQSSMLERIHLYNEQIKISGTEHPAASPDSSFWMRASCFISYYSPIKIPSLEAFIEEGNLATKKWTLSTDVSKGLRSEAEILQLKYTNYCGEARQAYSPEKRHKLEESLLKMGKDIHAMRNQNPDHPLFTHHESVAFLVGLPGCTNDIGALSRNFLHYLSEVKIRSSALEQAQHSPESFRTDTSAIGASVLAYNSDIQTLSDECGLSQSFLGTAQREYTQALVKQEVSFFLQSTKHDWLGSVKKKQQINEEITSRQLNFLLGEAQSAQILPRPDLVGNGGPILQILKLPGKHSSLPASGMFPGNTVTNEFPHDN